MCKLTVNILHLFLQAFFCECFAISATRMYVQMERQIVTDPCDNRIIRLNNLIQLLACICQILAMIDSSFQACAEIMKFIADVVYAIVSSCMQAQTHLELKLHPTAADYEGGAPPPIKQQPRAVHVWTMSYAERDVYLLILIAQYPF